MWYFWFFIICYVLSSSHIHCCKLSHRHFVADVINGLIVELQESNTCQSLITAVQEEKMKKAQLIDILNRFQHELTNYLHQNIMFYNLLALSVNIHYTALYTNSSIYREEESWQKVQNLQKQLHNIQKKKAEGCEVMYPLQKSARLHNPKKKKFLIHNSVLSAT